MHCLETAPTHGGREVDVESSIFVERFSRTKFEPEKLEPDVLVAAGTIDILTVDDLGFVRVDLQSTFPESCSNPLEHKLRLTLTSAVKQAVIGITTEWHEGHDTTHPDIKRVMKEKIGEERADDPSLRSPARSLTQITSNLS
jgi:hypothetical protein